MEPLLFFRTFLYVFGTLFAVINPIGAVPVFLSIIQHCRSYEGRMSLAKRISEAVFVTLTAFTLLGSGYSSFWLYNRCLCNCRRDFAFQNGLGNVEW